MHHMFIDIKRMGAKAPKLLSDLYPDEIDMYHGLYHPYLYMKSDSRPSSSQQSLTTLDNWYQGLDELQRSSDVKKGIHDKPTLIRLVRWKLAREKFRPTLLSLVSSNSVEQCSDVLKRAASSLFPRGSLARLEEEAAWNTVKRAMDILVELKGVGPATASAIVATWIPEGMFQSDELAMALMGDKVKISYTMGFYKKFYMKAIKFLARLEGTRIWDGRGLERVAWAMYNDPEKKGAGVGKEAEEAADGSASAEVADAAAEGKDQGESSEKGKRKGKAKTSAKDGSQGKAQKANDKTAGTAGKGKGKRTAAEPSTASDANVETGLQRRTSKRLRSNK
ncbi:hypothetical protein PHSY_007478 [Pseudozyma hubeiensis SY62]|uniref:Uncharacterized protein n=1 Tax=Pseudozyma hubeiensis (strain SY62) TaxID=1305764 RepID=R9PP55_PSEHS|nr:hypothetical protein PHSY_007478 [Pseudozyma hubeiensis SY62]GAC99875.1 hypothetical protein PHSY_007478 [Pseudozyma hubeiensis SY62]